MAKELLKIPYETAEERGVYLDLEVDQKNLAASFIPDEDKELPDFLSAVLEAVENPVEGKKFSELIGPGKKVTFITENQFRAADVSKVLPALVKKAKDAGAEVAVVIGCGKVPALNEEEIKEKLGEEVATSVPVYCNDVSQKDNYRYLGITSAGTPLWVHKVVTDADVKIALNTTQATLWGYGGSGMVIPAVAGNETIETNHVMALAPDCVPGNNDCRMQLDKYEALEMAKIDMNINIIVNNKWQNIFVNAGHPVASHRAAVAEYDKIYAFDCKELKENPVDICITGSSAPTDHLFFHTGWAVVNCAPITKPGGIIIMATPCPGYGDWPGFALMDLMKEFLPANEENHEKVLSSFFTRERELWAGCIWHPIYETMLTHDVRLVTREENLEFARSVGFKAYATIEEAYADALKDQGEDARVAFVPYGRYTVLR